MPQGGTGVPYDVVRLVMKVGRGNLRSRISSWAKTWNELLKSDQAERVKKTMDFLMPKSQVILARKPE